MKALRTRTYSATASEAKAGQRWYLIDAEGQVLGRVATTVAQLLRGKGKPTFTPHMDTGDFVIVINADKIVVTGKKETDKVYHRHSGYPGGMKVTALKDVRAKHPIRILEAAVRGMLPKNSLGKKVYLHMKVYAGPNHPHEAQKPVRLELARDGHKRGQVTDTGAATLVIAPAPAPATVAPPTLATATDEPTTTTIVEPTTMAIVEPGATVPALAEPMTIETTTVATPTAGPQEATTDTTRITSTEMADDRE